MYQRKITGLILQRLEEKRRFIQVVLGPRQVGKTTALHQILEKIKIPYHYAAADLPAPPDTGWIARQWHMARLQSKEKLATVLVLDEVQKISHWSEEVKRLWDEDTRFGKNLYVVLLGSSSLLIHKGLSESLAGRFEVVRFPHWSWEECRDSFGWTLDQYLYFGGYPGSASLISDENRWSQYIRDSLIETAISKDILLINRVEKPALLRQLFVLSCEYGGQILSYQKMMGQLTDAGNTVTLSHYRQLLESAFLIQGLSKYSTKTIRQRSSSPKWLPLNTALVSSLSNRSFKEYKNDPESWGRLTEVAVGTHLVNAGQSHGINVYYWRQENDEVDFVIQKGKKIVAIEVKSSSKEFYRSGLNQFLKCYPTSKTLIVGSSGVCLKTFFETSPLNWF